jgi:hypothetical protein
MNKFNSNADCLYLLKILQCIRLLTRNNLIREKISKEKVISTFEQILEQLIGFKSEKPSQNEVIDNCFIEIISIIKRYFYSNLDILSRDNSNSSHQINNEIIDKIINKTKIIDHFIFLLNRDNMIVLKILHFLLISVIEE